jgi:hypothetical protein
MIRIKEFTEIYLNKTMSSELSSVVQRQSSRNHEIGKWRKGEQMERQTPPLRLLRQVAKVAIKKTMGFSGITQLLCILLKHTEMVSCQQGKFLRQVKERQEGKERRGKSCEMIVMGLLITRPVPPTLAL